MKDYTSFEDGFGKILTYSDLKAYNSVIELASESAFKSIFGYWVTKKGKVIIKIFMFLFSTFTH